MDTIIISPDNVAELSGKDVTLLCKTSDGAELYWAKSDDRGQSWTYIAIGDEVIGDPEKYEVDTTENNVTTPGVYNLRILDLVLQDAALYRCQHLILFENVYAHAIVMGESQF